MLILCVLALITATNSQVDNCTRYCGDVRVDYPFGFDRPSGAVGIPNCTVDPIDPSFMLVCNHSFKPPRLLMFHDSPVHNISIEDGTISVKISPVFMCFDGEGMIQESTSAFSFENGPFRFSDSYNKLTAIGCDTIVMIRDSKKTFGSGCISLCNQTLTLNDSSSGLGICQTSVPRNLVTLDMFLSSPTNHSSVWKFNPCSYGFLADQRTFDISDWQLSTLPYSLETREFVTTDVALEWVISRITCDEAEASSDYACGDNTYCSYSENAQGYRCLCMHGFKGNPYIPLGCQDIDECKKPNKYPCHGSCKNNIGNYTCNCPMGMRGDAKTGNCHGIRITTVVAVLGAALLAMVIAILVFMIYRRRKKEQNFFRNGGVLLKNQRVRIFSETELAKATKNYNQLLGEGGFGSVYKGELEDGTLIAVKKAKETAAAQLNQEYHHEIGIVSQVNHKNVVRILGLCLETKIPLLVYEFISNGTLFHHIHLRKSQALANWQNGLRIAEEIALALEYLHSLANPPIIHGDVKSLNVLLDDTFTAKVSDFGASVLTSPEEYGFATKFVQGTLGYLDPEYLSTGVLTEKSDVYSFGVVLVELVTGVNPNSTARNGENKNIIHYFLRSVESHSVDDILCFQVEDEGELEEIEAFAEMVKQCLQRSGTDRPTMNEVAEEFGRLRKMKEKGRWNAGKEKIEQETEYLLGESSNQREISSPRSFELDRSHHTI